MPKGVYTRIEGKIYGMFGKHHSEQSILKNSLSHIGKPAWNKNKSPSEETRLKQSISHIGKVRSEESKLKQSQTSKGRISGMKGKSQTEEAKLKMSISLKGKNTGDKNGMWNNGSSFEPYPLGWTKTHKEQVRIRDDYRCQLCGCPQIENIEKLSIHHIDYNKDNINLGNLISLCSRCHSKTNTRREHWVKYFKGNII